jgi:2-dehydro-3-deoxy-D-arabinonate dehydratase
MPTQIARVQTMTGEVRLALTRDGHAVGYLPNDLSLAAALQLRLLQLESLVDAAETADEPVRFLAPIDGDTEVWAAGVTYKRSEEARVEESATPDIYTYVYRAERPELFFKANARRVAGPEEAVVVRADSTWDVPEPEVALVINSSAEIVGYTIGNDVSSRSIEGENPLYLPQAKVYAGCCALGPGITPAWEVADPYALGIRMRIERNGAVHWSATSSARTRIRTV